MRLPCALDGRDRIREAIIAALDVMLVAAIYRSLHVNRAAGLLLLPYLLWIVYASSLNVGIVALNP